MLVFVGLGSSTVTTDREVLGVYSTREQAQALIQAQDPELRLWMRVEEIILDESPADDFWKRSNARAVVIAELASLAAGIVTESGRQEDFDLKIWVLDWLKRPHPALAGKCPVELLDTEEGRRSLREVLGRLQSGAHF